MKKLLSLLLCIVLAISLCACGKDSKNDKKDKKDSSVSESSSNDSSKEDESSKDKDSSTNDSSKEDESSKDKDSSTNDSNLSGKEIKDGKFTYTSGGISLEVPSDWKSADFLMMTVLAKDPTAEEADCAVLLMAFTEDLTDGEKVKFSDIENDPSVLNGTGQVEEGVKFEKVKVGGKNALYYSEQEDGTISKGYILDGKVPVMLVIAYEDKAKDQADKIINSIKYID